MGIKKTKNILIVDDSPLIQEILLRILSDDYSLLKANNGKEAISILSLGKTHIQAVLLDLVMPELDGFAVLEYMGRHHLLEAVPVIMITAEQGERFITKAYDMGASEVIQKPFNRNIIKKRIKNLIDLYTQKNHLEEMVALQTQALQIKNKKLTRNNDVMIDALSAIIEYRSLESGQHTKRIRSLTKVLLEHMGEAYPHIQLDKHTIEMVSSAAALHDIGKIAIPDSILLKPGRLTDEEFEIMKTHTTKGSEMLFQLSGLDDERYLTYCYEICLHHHERWDGNGYPDGLKAEQIPLSAHAVALADVYDALTHKRVYKPAYSFEKAANMILEGKCGAFSPTLLKCFQKAIPDLDEVMEFCADNEEHEKKIKGFYLP